MRVGSQRFPTKHSNGLTNLHPPAKSNQLATCPSFLSPSNCFKYVQTRLNSWKCDKLSLNRKKTCPKNSRAKFWWWWWILNHPELFLHNNGVCQITEHLDVEGDAVCARNTGTFSRWWGWITFTADFWNFRFLPMI